MVRRARRSGRKGGTPTQVPLVGTWMGGMILKKDISSKGGQAPPGPVVLDPKGGRKPEWRFRNVKIRRWDKKSTGSFAGHEEKESINS